jgi:hypothetical protein
VALMAMNPEAKMTRIPDETGIMSL